MRNVYFIRAKPIHRIWASSSYLVIFPYILQFSFPIVKCRVARNQFITGVKYELHTYKQAFLQYQEEHNNE